MKTDRLWTVDDVARYLGVSKGTVYTYHARQGLPGAKLGTQLRFHPTQVEMWFMQRVIQNESAKPEGDGLDTKPSIRFID